MLLTSHIAGTIGSPVGEFFGIPSLYRVTLGGLAVTGFLVLSGAVLQLRYGGKRIDYSQFLFRRVLRIYPVYYISLLVAATLLLMRLRYETGAWGAGFPTLDLSDLALSLSGTYAFAGRWGGPILSTGWYIGVIMTMYLVFPLLSRHIDRHPIGVLGLAFLVSLLSRVIVGNDLLPLVNRPLDWFPPCRVFEFTLGVFLATVVPRRTDSARTIPATLRSATALVGRVSFPLFLIHYPLLFVIPVLAGLGIPQSTAIAVYLPVSFAVGVGIQLADEAIPRTRMLAAFERAVARPPRVGVRP